MTWSKLQAGKKPEPQASRPSPRQAEGPSPRPDLGGVVRRAREAPGALTPRDVMVLQRTIGNRATCQLLQAARLNRPPAPAPVAARLPDRLRAGVERLSGLLMGDVRVHYGSPEPAGVDAAAYARGGDIHLAPGAEEHLPHEAWHVAQQRQGRVRPSAAVAGVPVNDDPALEREADRVGEAMRQGAVAGPAAIAGGSPTLAPSGGEVAQRVILDPDAPEWKQIFGMDFAEGLSEEKRIEALTQALRVGYRVFDGAEIYGTLQLLQEAARRADVPMAALTVINKVKPKSEDEVKAPEREKQRKEADEFRRKRGLPPKPNTDTPPPQFAQRLKASLEKVPGAEQILMLHEMPVNLSEAKAYIDEMQSQARDKKASGIGLSNVDVHELEELWTYADGADMPIRYVENRFSPYQQDDAVRKFCSDKGIRYVAFGVLGSKTTGVCFEGPSEPTENLLTAQDPRVIKLAERKGVPANQLVLAWANAQGVSVVTTSQGHAAENFDAASLHLDADTLAEMRAFFTLDERTAKRVRTEPVSEEPGNEVVPGNEEPGYGKPGSERPIGIGLEILYATVKDNTVHHILDLLLDEPKSHGLIARLVDEIVQTSKKEELDDRLTKFTKNLQRLVAQVQTQVGEEGTQKILPWQTRIASAFTGLAEKLGKKGSLAKLLDWTRRDYHEKGGASHALEEFGNLH